MKHKIFLLFFLTLSVNLFAQTYVSSTRQNMSITIYNNADLQIGKDSVKRITDLYSDGSTIVRDSLIARTTFQFIKDVTDGQLDFTNTNGILSATIQSGSITDAMLQSQKESTIIAGTTSQYYRGDKTFQTLDKSAVGLSNVDNTSDANKPISTATQTALNGKQETLVSGTNIKTVNGNSLLGAGDLVISGGGGGGAPAGANGTVQYNNLGALAGATNLQIVGNDLRLYAKRLNTNESYIQYDSLQMKTLSAGLFDFTQKRISLLTVNGQSAVSGLSGGSFTVGGTAQSQSINSTNIYTRSDKLIIRQNTAATTAIASYRETFAKWYRGVIANAGGFDACIRFGYNEGPTTSINLRSFVGYNSNTAAPTDVEPSSLTNIIGVGFDAADNNFNIMVNDGSGVATKVNTGISVPATNGDRIFELRMICKPNGTDIKFIFSEVGSIGYLSTFTHTASTDLPTNSTYLAFKAFASCGGISCNPAITIVGVYCEGNI